MQDDILYRGYRISFSGAVYAAEPANHNEDFLYLSSTCLITVIDAIDVIHTLSDDIPIWLDKWVNAAPEEADGECNYIDLDAVFRPVANLPAAIANHLDPTGTALGSVAQEPWPLDADLMRYSPISGKVSF